MKQKGFSLIEVMLVVLIISIITAICMPGYVRHVQRSRLTNTMLPALRILEQNVAIYYLSNEKMPGEVELPIITGGDDFSNMRVSLNGGEISIVIDAPRLTDKIHVFDGQEIRATPEIRDGRLTSFRLSGPLALILGF